MSIRQRSAANRPTWHTRDRAVGGHGPIPEYLLWQTTCSAGFLTGEKDTGFLTGEKDAG